MTAQQGKNHVHVERVFDHDGQVIISMSGQTRGQWFRSAQRPIAYVLVDLKRKRAQAAPNLQAFQSVYSLNISKVNPGLIDRMAYSYGFKVERAEPLRKPRFTISENAKFQGRVIRLKTKTPLKYRMRAVLRKVSDRLRFRFIEVPSTVPLRKRPSIRQSWLGGMTKEKDHGKVLQELGIPREEFHRYPILTRDQNYSRFCNLATQKGLDWLYDRNFQFEPRGPRHNLLSSVEMQQKKQVEPKLQAVDYGERKATMTVLLGNGKTVTVSLTSGSREAWNQILATPLRQRAERWVVQQGFIQQKDEPNLGSQGHTFRRHAIQESQTLKITERFRTNNGEVMKIELRGRQSVYLSLSDSSPEAVAATLSPKVRMERKRTPLMPQKQQQKAQRPRTANRKRVQKAHQQKHHQPRR
jgi:hypothetical protein